ncbi:UDP-N-acetylglucosamine 3-dehydrogenase, partial [Lachnellula suecica]
MSSPPLKIAIIGGGLIGHRHGSSVLTNPSTTLTALVEPSPSGPSTAAFLHTTHYTSLSSLLASPHKPDAAIVCTPNNTHVSLSLELIEAGVHVLVEKPISESVEEGRVLVERAREKGVKLLVGHHRRFNPYLLATKAHLSSSSLGKIIAVQGTWCLLKPASYFEGTGGWRQEAGVVMINLIHEVDLLQFLLGPIVLVSALATSKTRGYKAEDGAVAMLRFESGVVGTFVLSDAVPSPWSFEGGTGENPM